MLKQRIIIHTEICIMLYICSGRDASGLLRSPGAEGEASSRNLGGSDAFLNLSEILKF
eukprot:SAG22_NODE_11825_length_467_cov_5.301630_1_plen_58_part_00